MSLCFCISRVRDILARVIEPDNICKVSYQGVAYFIFINLLCMFIVFLVWKGA